MLNVNQAISAALGTAVDTTVEQTKTVSGEVLVCSNNLPEIAQADFEYARNNLRTIINDGQAALTELIDLATQAQDAKIYDAMSKTLAAMVTANKELLQLSKLKRDIDKSDPSKTDPKANTQNLFVGTTTDLLQMLADARIREQQGLNGVKENQG